MKIKPSVTIIVPVYNTKEYLNDCIESVRQQTKKDIEIIIVDDGSTDGSGAVCDSFVEKDERVKVFHQENMGVSVARNRGIKEASGEWIMFLDSDDYLEIDAIELAYSMANDNVDWVILPFCDNMSSLAERNNSVARVYYDMSEYREYFLCACRLGDKPWYPSSMLYALRLTSQCAKLFKRQIIVEKNIEFPVGVKNNEDGFFNMQYVLHIENVIFHNMPIYRVRLRENSGSRSLDSMPKKIKESIEYYDIFLRNNNIHLSQKRYQHIDAIQKAELMMIIYTKQHIHCGRPIRDCIKEYSTLINSPVWISVVDEMSIKELYSVEDKLVALMLKYRWFHLLMLLFVVYYKIK